MSCEWLAGTENTPFPLRAHKMFAQNAQNSSSSCLAVGEAWRRRRARVAVCAENQNPCPLPKTKSSSTDQKGYSVPFFSRSGSVCLDVINQTWSPMYDMINIFEAFLPHLLRYPNPSDPLNGEAAALMLRDPKGYDAKVRGNQFSPLPCSDLLTSRCQTCPPC